MSSDHGSAGPAIGPPPAFSLLNFYHMSCNSSATGRTQKYNIIGDRSRQSKLGNRQRLILLSNNRPDPPHPRPSRPALQRPTRCFLPGIQTMSSTVTQPGSSTFKDSRTLDRRYQEQQSRSPSALAPCLRTRPANITIVPLL